MAPQTAGLFFIDSGMGLNSRVRKMNAVVLLFFLVSIALPAASAFSEAEYLNWYVVGLIMYIAPNEVGIPDFMV